MEEALTIGEVISANTRKITNIVDPTADQDAATKKYVDDNAGGGVAAFKNILINGGFTINQRAYVSAAALASGSYGHDRWKAGTGGGDYSFTQLNSPTTITIAANKTLIQVVEDKNVQGGSYTLSWTGTAQGRYAVDSATPTGAYADSPIAITGQSAGTTMSVEFDDGTLSKVQLEPGTSETEFENLPYDVQLARCLRYTWIINTEANAFQRFGAGYNQTTSTANLIIYPRVPMRAVPSLTYSALSDFVVLYNGNSSNTPSIIAISGSGSARDLFAVVFITTGTPLTAGGANFVQAAGTTASRLIFSAEL